MKKPSTAVAGGEADVRRRFEALFDKVNYAGGRPRESDVARLRGMLREHPDLELWRRVPGPGRAAIDHLLQMNIAGAAMSEAWRERAAHLEKEMGYDSASPAEQLLIAHAVACWLQLGFIQLHYAQILAGRNSPTLAQGRHWDRRLSMAQRRFTRALTELERLRALSAAARYGRARADEAERQRPRPNLSDEERATRAAEILDAGRERLQAGPRALTA